MTVQPDAAIQHFQSLLNRFTSKNGGRRNENRSNQVLRFAAGCCRSLGFRNRNGGAEANPNASTAKTFTGFISDASCGLEHIDGMNERDCTLMCAKNGSFVLADREKKVVYQLDAVGQRKAPEFAGQKVKVKGRVVGKRIRVTSIELA